LFDLLKPVGLNGVSNELHRCLKVILDLALVLVVGRLERVLGRRRIQPQNATTTPISAE